jgi:hypothetical protein
MPIPIDDPSNANRSGYTEQGLRSLEKRLRVQYKGVRNVRTYQYQNLYWYRVQKIDKSTGEAIDEEEYIYFDSGRTYYTSINAANQAVARETRDIERQIEERGYEIITLDERRIGVKSSKDFLNRKYQRGRFRDKKFPKGTFRKDRKRPPWYFGFVGRYRSR